MEQPQIAGVAGGVGTSTLAAALRARDCGIYRGGDVVDVLVARSSMYSLGCAQRAIAATPAPPVLAVVTEVPGSLPGVVKTRLRMTEPHVAAIVVLPFVLDWAERDNPHGDATHLLVAEPASKSARAFRDALLDLVEQITPRVIARSTGPFPPAMTPPGSAYPPLFAPEPVAATWPSAR